MKSKLVALIDTVKNNADVDALFGIYYGGITFAVLLTFIGGFR